MNRTWRAVLLACTVLAVVAANAETKEAKIKRALSAAPANVANNAKVVDMDEKGNMAVLREGGNGFTCVAGHPGVVGDDPVCLDAAGFQWLLDFLAHKPKPTNMQPGIAYLLAGGTDWSNTDPWATAGTPVKHPPQWIILWPFDAKAAGLADKPTPGHAWVMWAGTPYAHLMMNQRP